MATLKSKDLISISLLSEEEVDLIVQESDAVKKGPRNTDDLQGKALAMIFEKSSTRTRVSFETGIYQLGGIGMFFSPQDLQMGRGETIHDTAKVLSRYVDGIMARVFEHQKILDQINYYRKDHPKNCDLKPIFPRKLDFNKTRYSNRR